MPGITAVPPPELNIPSSQHTVDVSIIDTTGPVGNIPVAAFMTPAMAGYEFINPPCYSFLIKHSNPNSPSKYDHLLFDLGIRKDWESGPPAVVDRAKEGKFTIKVEKNVVDILRENGDDPAKDHTGDSSTFPSSSDLIVGPAFKARFVPGYPTVADSPIHDSAYEGRQLREIDFETEGKGLELGGYKAIDLYGDGSFYLVNSPGHATGHICGLARTSADPPEFIIMGGDIAHHGGEFRPTNPLVAPYTKSAPVCPGAVFEAIHPKKSSTKPYTQPTGPIHDSAEGAIESLEKFTEFDAQDNIFAMIAHDMTLFDVVDFYPKPANGWWRKGWKEQGRWRFLKDFDTTVETGKA